MPELDTPRRPFPFREALLALVLLLSEAAVVNGVARLSVAAAWILGGVLTAALGVLFLAEVSD